MSQVHPKVGVDPIGNIAVRGPVDSGEFRLLGAGGAILDALPIPDYTGGIRRVNLFPLFSGKKPGGYAVQAVVYKSGEAVLGTPFVVDYDPVSVSSARTQPSSPQVTVDAWGGFSGL